MTATARDAAGNQSTASITVTIAVPDTTAPAVNITSPGNGQTVSGSVTVAANATDNVGVAGVQFLLDGRAYGTEITAAPYSLSWSSASVANGSHTIAATARDAAGNKTTCPNMTITVSNVAAPAAAKSTAVRVNAGGPAYTDPSGNLWAADTGYTGGYVYSPGTAVTGTTTPALYQTQRWNDQALNYQLAVPNGLYNVNLKFAELYFSQAGQRMFGIVVNGQTLATNFDIVQAAGGPFKAVDRSFQVSVTTGQVAIQLTSSVDDPAINAIEIVPVTRATVRVNAGGPAYTANGTVWSADTGSSAGFTYATAAAIANTTTAPLISRSTGTPAPWVFVQCPERDVVR